MPAPALFYHYPAYNTPAYSGNGLAPLCQPLFPYDNNYQRTYALLAKILGKSYKISPPPSPFFNPFKISGPKTGQTTLL